MEGILILTYKALIISNFPRWRFKDYIHFCKPSATNKLILTSENTVVGDHHSISYTIALFAQGIQFSLHSLFKIRYYMGNGEKVVRSRTFSKSSSLSTNMSMHPNAWTQEKEMNGRTYKLSVSEPKGILNQSV